MAFTVVTNQEIYQTGTFGSDMIFWCAADVRYEGHRDLWGLGLQTSCIWVSLISGIYLLTIIPHPILCKGTPSPLGRCKLRRGWSTSPPSSYECICLVESPEGRSPCMLNLVLSIPRLSGAKTDPPVRIWNSWLSTSLLGKLSI